MAAKENQGLVFSLIMLVTLSLMLLVACFLIFRNYQDASAKLVAQTEAAGKAEENLRRTVAELTEIKQSIIGMPNADSPIEEVRAQLAQNLARFGGVPPRPPADPTQPPLAGGPSSYIGLADGLFAQVQSFRTRLNEADANLRATEAKLVSATKEYQETLARISQNFAQYKAEYDATRQRLEQQFATTQSQAGELLARSQTFQKQIEAAEQKLGAQITDLEKQLASLRDVHEETLNTIDESRKDNFDVPDGEVRWVGVTAGRRTAYISVGSADALPPRATFSVYERNSQNVASAVKKANLEVTTILGPHLAAATITNEDPRRPVSEFDTIYSPTWRPGAAQHVAIAGFIDIDQDGRSDLPELLELIRASGGIVDAIVDEKGQSPKGQEPDNMTIETRFLILGERPSVTDGTGAEAAGAISGYSKILEKARVLSVRRVSVSEFMDYMGYTKRRNLRQYGQGSSGSPRAGGSAATYRRLSTF